MAKENIEYKVKKTGLNGEIALIKDGKEVKVVPTVIFSEDQVTKLYETMPDYYNRLQ